MLVLVEPVLFFINFFQCVKMGTALNMIRMNIQLKSIMVLTPPTVLRIVQMSVLI